MTEPATLPDPAGPLLSAHGMADWRAAVVHYSLGPEPSYIGVREPGARTTPVIEFLALPTLGAELVAAIGAVDDGARRLLGRFSGLLPATMARLESFDMGADLRTPALGWVFGAASMILDLEEPDLTRALRGSTPSLRLDTVVIEEGARYLVDSRRLLRSVMSYRVAGVPGYVLARSVFESLGEFASDAVRRLLRDWPAEVVACVGDLYTRNALLRAATQRGLVGLRLPVIMPEPPAQDES